MCVALQHFYFKIYSAFKASSLVAVLNLSVFVEVIAMSFVLNVNVAPLSRWAGLLLCCFALTLSACGKKTPPAATDQASAAAKPTAVRVSKGVAEPAEEPSEQVLRTFLEEEYAQMQRQGGITLSSTSSGNSVKIIPRLYEAKKESCKRLPSSIGGGYECSMSTMITLDREGARPSTPSEKGERVYAYWDGEKGAWASGTPPPKKRQ